MTRETKIGLLVGLAFIIVIGILLSEHVTNTNEPASASVAGAGGNVREGVMSPGADGNVGPFASADPTDAPRDLVPTQSDLQARSNPPAGYVRVGPGGAGQPPLNVRQRGQAPPAAQANDPDPAGPLAQGQAPRDGSDPQASIRELMRQHPGDFAPVPPAGQTNSPSPRNAGNPAAPRTYIAEAGDSLSRMAARLYGSNSKTNRDLIVRANPNLFAADNTTVYVGKVYVIPNAPTPAVANAGNAAGAPGSTPPAAARPSAPAAPRNVEVVWYTVQENDNLWRIAESQLGTGNAWAQIRDLNRDVLNGGETVHPNMRLRLPAHPVASAN